MCELLAYSAKSSEPLNQVLNAFYKRAKYHPHGWGQVILDNNNPEITKEPINAIKSIKLHKLLENPIDSKALIAHIRYATTGDMKYENTHPFEIFDNSGRRWVLIHNGTVLKDEIIQKYESSQQGDTDSERIIMLIADEMNKNIEKKNRPLDSQERFEIIDNIIHELSKDNNKLNLIIHDGEQFYIHTNGYGQMHQTSLGDGILFCTREINIPDYKLSWTDVPRLKTLCYKDGKLVNYGEEHGNEYIPDPEIEKELIARYAHLN